MRTIVMLAIFGFLAQLVDGSLGMGYGVTSTTLLLLIGANPALASATVHLAEVGTTAASGFSHWRFGNVDWIVVVRVGLPGAVGAFIGATLLSSLSLAVGAPVISLLLLALGIFILLRSAFSLQVAQNTNRRLRKRFLIPLGLLAGFVDATGGGGWGPVGTPALLASGRLDPRKVIGSIDTSEFFVALAASFGFLFGMGRSAIPWASVLALLAGGLVAAPIAAWLVQWAPQQILGIAIGSMILLTNLRTLLGPQVVQAASAVRYSVYCLVLLVGLVLVTRAFVQRQAGPKA